MANIIYVLIIIPAFMIYELIRYLKDRKYADPEGRDNRHLNIWYWIFLEWLDR